MPFLCISSTAIAVRTDAITATVTAIIIVLIIAFFYPKPSRSKRSFNAFQFGHVKQNQSEFMDL